MARPGFMKHPKFRALVWILKVPEAHALGYCELLWMAAYESGEEFIGGVLQVEATAGWPGQPGALCNAMLDCGGPGRAGLIERTSDGADTFKVHDLFDHAPDYVKDRRRKELQRKGKGCPNLSGKVRKCPKKSGTPAPAPAPAPALNTPPLPPKLDTEEFRPVWDLWKQHRKEIKKPLKPISEKQQLSKLEEMGVERAVACLRHSMANGWQGLFEPQQKTQPARASPKTLMERVVEARLRVEERNKCLPKNGTTGLNGTPQRSA